jgi:hypothetical protein
MSFKMNWAGGNSPFNVPTIIIVFITVVAGLYFTGTLDQFIGNGDDEPEVPVEDTSTYGIESGTLLQCDIAFKNYGGLRQTDIVQSQTSCQIKRGECYYTESRVLASVATENLPNNFYTIGAYYETGSPVASFRTSLVSVSPLQDATEYAFYTVCLDYQPEPYEAVVGFKDKNGEINEWRGVAE